MSTAQPIAQPPALLTPRQTRVVLAVMALALMTVVSAVSGLNVAIPSLARDTGASQSQLTWIVDAYTVVFAGLLLFAGAVGDRFGRREILLVGLVVFAAGAGLAMTTDVPEQLIAYRAGMGVGAACIMPTTLSVITTSFPESERPRAIGVWVGMAGGGAVLGLFASAILLEFFSWSSFFALNLVLAGLAFVGTVAFVPSSRDADAPALDVVGAVLSLVAVASLVFAIIEGPVQGWSDPWTIAAFAVGLAAGIGFVDWELRVPRPMLDPRIFAGRDLSAGTLSITAQFFAAFGFFFAILQYLQFVVGYTPLEAVVRMLPIPIVLIPLARRTPIIAARVGFRRVGPLGLLSMAAGLLVLSTLGLELDYPVMVIGLVLFAAGMALAGTPATTAITSSLPASKQGVASALNDTAREFGSALGIAVLGSVINQGYRTGLAEPVAQLPSGIADRILDSIAFVASPAVGQLGPTGQALVEQARTSFLDGVSTAFVVSAAILAVVAVIVFARSAPAPRSQRP